MKSIIKKLQLRRSKDIIDIETSIIESFISGRRNHNVYTIRYFDSDMYFSYFKNHCKLKSIFESVEKYEFKPPKYYDSRVSLLHCMPDPHFIITFKKYDLDIKDLEKIVLKEVYGVGSDI